MSGPGLMLLWVVGFALLVYCMGLAGVDVELSRGRIAACLLAGAVLVTLVLAGEPTPKLRRLYYGIFGIPFLGLAFVWFGDEFGSPDGTPGVALRLMGWLLLIGAGIGAVWVVVLTSQH